MNNIYLLITELLINILALIIICKKEKVIGIYLYSIILFILSNLMSLKTITIYNFNLNLGIISFVSIFIASNILVQKKGYEETKRYILLVIASSIISYIFLYFISLMESSNINLFTNKSFDNIFEKSARIYFANIVTMLYMLILNNKLYSYLKQAKNKILISNLFSGIIIQFLASIIFLVVAYSFTTKPLDIIRMIIIRYMISLIIIIIGTIPIYIINKFKIE